MSASLYDKTVFGFREEVKGFVEHVGSMDFSLRDDIPEEIQTRKQTVSMATTLQRRRIQAFPGRH
jgi:hypothetical protein